MWDRALVGEHSQMHDEIWKHAIKCGTLHPNAPAMDQARQEVLAAGVYESPCYLVMDVALKSASSDHSDFKQAEATEVLLRSGWPMLSEHQHTAILSLSRQNYNKYRIILLILWEFAGLKRKCKPAQRRVAPEPSITAAIRATKGLQDCGDFKIVEKDGNAEKELGRLEQLLDLVCEVFSKVAGAQMSPKQFLKLNDMVKKALTNPA